MDQDALVAANELEAMITPAPQQLWLPRTRTSCLVGFVLALCVAGLAAQSSVVVEQLHLYRSLPASHPRASTAPQPSSPSPANVSSESTDVEHQHPLSDAGSRDQGDVGSSLPSTTPDAGDLMTPRGDDDAHRESESTVSSDTSSASLGETNPTDTPPDVQKTSEHDDGPRNASSKPERQEDQSRPHPAALLLPTYQPPHRDESLPPQVHALWIGDVASVDPGLKRYSQMGFELTIHTSVDSILDGFAPHVRRAYSLAIPRVAGFDLLKLLLLYKLGGLVVDADTYPLVYAHQVTFASDCRVAFGKETHLAPWQFDKPTYRQAGGGITYGLNRPYQLLNWAMLAREPRNKHVAKLIDGAMRHFYGLRDMDESLVQDVSGSGLLTDYVALLYAGHGMDYVSAFNDMATAGSAKAVDGLCMLENELRDGWIHHDFMSTWRQPEQ